MIESYEKELKELYKQKAKIEYEIKQLEKKIQDSIKSFILLKDAIYIQKRFLSKELINSLKELASFPNPQVKLLQNLRKPTYNIPHTIKGYDETSTDIILPRGLMRSVISLLKQHNLNTTYIDKRFIKKVEFKKITLTPRDEQQKAIDHILKKDFSLFVAPPGYGKTFIGAKIIEARGVNTLIIVNKNLLLDQWIERFEQYFGYTKKDIGILGKSKNTLNFTLDIATMQSLKNNSEIIKKYSFVIVDECHHIPAVTFEKIIKQFEGKYILGLSATPGRKDGMQPLIFQQLGFISYEIKSKKTKNNKLEIVETDFKDQIDDFGALITALINDEKRNDLIIKQIEKYKDRKILLLSDRIEHIENLELLLRHKDIQYVSIHGSQKKEQQKENLQNIEKASVVLATTSFFGEGIDFAHLDTIIFATPISYYGRLIQYLGRVGRGGDDCIAIDILDIYNPLALKCYQKRKEGYKQLYYKQG